MCSLVDLEERKEYSRMYRLKNKEKKKEYQSRYDLATKDMKKEKHRVYYLANRERLRAWHREYRHGRGQQRYREASMRSYFKHKIERAKRAKERYWKRRLEVLRHYSSDKLECACCHETTLEFLCLDHKDGGGSKERRRIGSTRIWWYLIQKNFPSGYQILCHNCNQAKGFFGYCPHTHGSKLAETLSIQYGAFDKDDK